MSYRGSLPALLRKLEELEETGRANYERVLGQLEDKGLREKLVDVMEEEERHKRLVEKAVSLADRYRGPTRTPSSS